MRFGLGLGLKKINKILNNIFYFNTNPKGFVEKFVNFIEKFPLLGKSREYMFIKAEKVVNLNINTLLNIVYET